MSVPFLQNKKYSFVIAKVAIVFQSFITLWISLFLILLLLGATSLLPLLKLALLLDVLFVIAHLMYRALYTGEKVPLGHFEKRVLIIHSITSLMALSMTFVYINSGQTGSLLYTISTLFVWSISLISGIVFFIKKYFREVLLS